MTEQSKGMTAFVVVTGLVGVIANVVAIMTSVGPIGVAPDTRIIQAEVTTVRVGPVSLSSLTFGVIVYLAITLRWLLREEYRTNLARCVAIGVPPCAALLGWSVLFVPHESVFLRCTIFAVAIGWLNAWLYESCELDELPKAFAFIVLCIPPTALLLEASSTFAGIGAWLTSAAVCVAASIVSRCGLNWVAE